MTSACSKVSVEILLTIIFRDINHLYMKTNQKVLCFGAPGWLSQLSSWRWLRSWSHVSWVQPPYLVLCWQLRTWSLLQILCLPLSLPAPPLLMPSLSKINIKNNFLKKCCVFVFLTKEFKETVLGELISHSLLITFI